MKVLATKTIPTGLFFVIACCLFSSTCPRLLAGEKSESEVYTPPPGRLAKAKANLELVNFAAMRLAVEDLTKNFGDKYKNGHEYLRAIDGWQQRAADIKDAIDRGDRAAAGQVDEIMALQRKALLSNPLLDFDKMLLIKRKPLGDPRRSKGDPENDKGLGKFLGIPQQSSWQLHTMTDTDGWANEIALLSSVNPKGSLTTIYKPTGGRLVNEMDLHYDAEKIMFSMPDRSRPTISRTCTTSTRATCPTATSRSSPPPRSRASRATHRSTWE